jgi:hypothetical protein
VDHLLFLAENLPFTMQLTEHMLVEGFQSLVDRKALLPILIFINGRLIKWSRITVVNNCKYSYLLIKDMIEREHYRINAIILPSTSVCRETAYVNSKTRFVFAPLTGAYTDNPDVNEKYITVDIPDPDIYYEEVDVVAHHKFRFENIDESYKLTTDTMFVFSHGDIVGGADFGIKSHGMNIFSLAGEPILDGGVAKVFYTTFANLSKDGLMKIPNRAQMITEIFQHGTDAPDYIKDLRVPFDFFHKRTKTYDDNLTKSLEYIMKYDSSLMNEIYKGRSNIVTRQYTGAQILALKQTGDNDYIRMSRRIGDSNDNYVMIFHNGVLYSQHYHLLYDNKDFIVPLVGIDPSDHIEIVFFKNVENRTFPIVLYSDNVTDVMHMSPDIKMSRMALFTTNPEHMDFNIERGWMNYRIDYHWNRVSEGEVEIYPDNPYYFDKHLTLAGARQFRYVSYVIRPGADKEIKFRLPEEFAYCDEPEKYMVFVNGLKLDYRNFIVAIPETTTPFEFMNIYVNRAVKEGDRLDVFYVSDRLEEVLFTMNVNPANPVIIDRSLIRYNLSKDLYMVFLNGKKVRLDQAEDMDGNKLKLVDVDSGSNLCILKHIEDIEVLSALFDTGASDFDEVLNSLDLDKLRLLYNVDPLGTEPSFKEGELTDMKKVLYEMVRDYWLRPYVVSGDIFQYKYITKVMSEDGTEIEVFETGSEGEVIINANDLDLEIV